MPWTGMWTKKEVWKETFNWTETLEILMDQEKVSGVWSCSYESAEIGEHKQGKQWVEGSEPF